MKTIVLIGLGISAALVGAGAAIALKGWQSSAKVPHNLSADFSQIPVPSLCEGNLLNRVSNDLADVRTANRLLHNPASLLTNINALLNSEVAATLMPAPFPTISDRARKARVPVIMYHNVLPNPTVPWDTSVAEFERHLALIKEKGLTPISMDQLVLHLRTGASLPPKPILLTFDDNYEGQYKYAFPLLKQYNYPALWSVHTRYVGAKDDNPKAGWAELREMRDSGLITFASHTVNHQNLVTTPLSDAEILKELKDSKEVLERELGIEVKYFTYPEGDSDARVRQLVQEAGYTAALAMTLDAEQETTANQSPDLLSLMRFGQSRFDYAIEQADGGTPLPSFNPFAEGRSGTGKKPDFTTPVELKRITVNNLPLVLVYGGRPVTIHADTRGQVADIMKTTPAIAAVDGGYHSLEFLDSNAMIGPVLSQNSSRKGEFIIGNRGENPLLNGRPLVLISPTDVKFVPFDAKIHVSLESLQAELPDVTDAFVAGAWLVRDGKAQPAESFGKLYGFDAYRDRAFWGIDKSGRPVIGVTMEMIDSVGLGKVLEAIGLHEVVMLDSGASAALAYRGKSMMSYEPRPVPHVVALYPPDPAPITNANRLNCGLSQKP
jgi:peptidoglycan/xylan/chitin deacetylase (PgdA/CDA1 family)